MATYVRTGIRLADRSTGRLVAFVDLHGRTREERIQLDEQLLRLPRGLRAIDRWTQVVPVGDGWREVGSGEVVTDAPVATWSPWTATELEDAA